MEKISGKNNSYEWWELTNLIFLISLIILTKAENVLIKMMYFFVSVEDNKDYAIRSRYISICIMQCKIINKYF